jgi:hypothetical protein
MAASKTAAVINTKRCAQAPRTEFRIDNEETFDDSDNIFKYFDLWTK